MSKRRNILVAGVLIAALLPVVGADAGSRAHAPSRIEPGLLDATTGPVDVLVRFRGAVPAEIVRNRIPGLTVHHRFASVPAIYATASMRALRSLLDRDDLAFIERNHEIVADLETATVASRAVEVFDPAYGEAEAPVFDAEGQVVDGRGVGIAVVDTGLDGLHPDFQAGKVKKNVYANSFSMTEAQNTATSPHGTHVAGIALGTGTASGGVFRGAAPGASLYAFSVFIPSGRIVWPSVAFDWILQNGAAQDPPIRVVNNSWHCSGPCQVFNPDRLHMVLASKLAEAGITVTWSVGNDGGDGFVSTTNAEAQNPTPGIIGVANYSDEERGTRGGCLANSSSRGYGADPTTWPDVAAPGYIITSTWATHAGTTDTINQRLPNGTNNYRAISGTSMAAPHVAGVVALMLQANPSLRPAEIEYILKATAKKLSCGVGYVKADPMHTYDGANYAEGHGLIDALAAVRAAQTFTGIPDAPPAEPLPPEFVNVRTAVRIERTLYLSGADSFSSQPPAGDVPRARAMTTEDVVVHTTDPVDEPYAFDGAEFDVWMGTTGECPCIRFTYPRIRALLQMVRADASVADLGEEEFNYWYVVPGSPVHRDFAFRLDEPVQLAAGDRLRLSLRVDAPGTYGLPPVEGTWTMYTESRLTPTRLSLGQVVRPDAESPEYCRARQDCADIGGAHMISGMTCGTPAVRLTWYGPPGSSALFSCNTGHVSCVVPGMPEDPWGTCEVEQVIPTTLGSKGGICAYRTRDGEPVEGKGRCISTVLVEDDD